MKLPCMHISLKGPTMLMVTTQNGQILVLTVLHGDTSWVRRPYDACPLASGPNTPSA